MFERPNMAYQVQNQVSRPQLPASACCMQLPAFSSGSMTMSFQCCKTTSTLVSHVLIYNALCSEAVLVGIEPILAELYSSLKLNPDSTSEQSATYEQLMRSPLIVRCLSAQYALGSRGERPTISAKIAWVAINLKFTSLAFHYAINHINHVAEASQPGIHTALFVQELPSSNTRFSRTTGLINRRH